MSASIASETAPGLPGSPSLTRLEAERRLRQYAELAGKLRVYISEGRAAAGSSLDTVELVGKQRYERVVRDNLLHLGRLEARLTPEQRDKLRVPLRRARRALEALLASSGGAAR